MRCRSIERVERVEKVERVERVERLREGRAPARPPGFERFGSLILKFEI